MFDVLSIVLPVFLIVAIGYGAVRMRLYPLSGVAGLITYVNSFAAPCLLFRAMLTTEFAGVFDPAVIVPFYSGAFCVMAAGAMLARFVFGRSPRDAVSAGFAAAFSNTLMVGVPILQRAYGDEAMPIVFSIIGLHAPLLITVGSLAMEIARRENGGKAGSALYNGGRAAVRNPLLIGIVLGIAGNLAGLSLPGVLDEVTRVLASTVMPVALFGLGGALTAYRLRDQVGLAFAVSLLKLVVHPLIAWVLMVPVLGVDPAIARYGVLLAAMPAGINAYIFATQFRQGESVASNTVLLSTVASIVSVTVWLLILR